MAAKGFPLPPAVKEKLESVFDELINRGKEKIDDTFRDLLNKPRSGTGTKPETKTWPDRIVPIDEPGEVELTREDGTRVLKLSDAMEAVYVVLNNLPDWGPRFDPRSSTVQEKFDDAMNYLTGFADFMLTGQTSIEAQLTKIAKLMKLRLLSQKRPRVYATKSGRFRT